MTEKRIAKVRPLTPLRWIGDGAQVDRCLFLDRDGVINERRVGDYVRAWNDFVWREGAVASLKRLSDAVGLPLVVVTNQRGIGRGLVAVDAFLDIQERMRLALAIAGVPLAAWYCCPHRPEDRCLCRKPLPGMLQAAHFDLGLDLHRSYLIGDSESDIEAGKSVGCATWQIETPDELRDALEEVIALEQTQGGSD